MKKRKITAKATGKKSWFSSMALSSIFAWKRPLNPDMQGASSQYSFLSLSEILLRDFISAFCEGKHELIIKSGKPSKSEVAAAWAYMLFDYYDCIGAEKTKRYVSFAKQIEHYRFKIIFCSSVVDMYIIGKNIELKKQLAKIGFYFQASDTDEMIQKSAIGHIKAWDLEACRIQQDMEREFKDTGDEGSPMDRSTFITNLVAMNKTVAIGVNDAVITAEVYAHGLRLHNDTIQAQIHAQTKHAA